MRSATVVLLLLTLLSCRKRQEPDRFISSLRCGMTRVEVTQLAEKNGYGKSDAGWLGRASADPQAKTKELALADLTFHDGRLTAVRKGEYDPNTERVVYRTVDLCGK